MLCACTVGLPNDVRARGLGDRERPVRVVDEDQRDAPLLDRRLDARVVVVRAGDRLVVAPRQVVLKGPVLWIERLGRRRRGRCRHAETRGCRACGRHYCACSHLHPPSSGPAAPRSWNPHPSCVRVRRCSHAHSGAQEKSTKCGVISTACTLPADMLKLLLLRARTRGRLRPRATCAWARARACASRAARAWCSGRAWSSDRRAGSTPSAARSASAAARGWASGRSSSRTRAWRSARAR